MRLGKRNFSLTGASLVALFLSGLTLAPSALAGANPVLTSTSYFGEDGKETNSDLILKSLDLTVSVSGSFAETRALVEFYNPTSEVLEGNFELEMPADSLLIGYGLDINGSIREGVIVEKKQAERAFNTRIRRGVDPGLAEVDDTNAFTTRVFPINPEQIRQISVTFITPISDDSPYRLPLESPTEPAAINITVKGDVRANSVSLPGKLTPEWSTDGKTGVLMTGDLPLDDVLEIRSTSTIPYTLSRHSNGQPFLSIDLPSRNSAPKASDSIRVLWDTSLSHEATAATALSFMHEVIDRDRPYSLELIPFSRGVHEAHRRDLRPQGEELEYFASELAYNGATDLSAVFNTETERSRADICYLVTDGRLTLGEFPEKALPCTLHVVTAAPNAEDDMLAHLARLGGGQYIDLAEISEADAFDRLSRRQYLPNRLTVDGEDALANAEWSDNGDRFRLMLPVEPDIREFRLDLDGRSLSASLDMRFANRNDAAGASWAQLRLTSLRAKGTDRADLVALSRRYSVVSDETSLLVLETLFDYVENGLPLPDDSFSKDEFRRYSELMEQKEADERQAKDQRLEKVLALWKNQQDWYSGKNRPDRKPGPVLNSELSEEAAMAEAEDWSANMPPPPPPPRPVMAERVNSQDYAEAEETLFVTGTPRRSEASETDETGAPVGQISIEAWTPDRPYLEDAIGKCGPDLYIHYEFEREEHGSLPSYYLEMADLFDRCGDPETAINVLLSAMELPTANDDTLTAVASRLIRYGDAETAIELFRKVVERDPTRPQPWRNLALALQTSADSDELPQSVKKARLEESLRHINHVIANPWDVRFEGIETISVLEANQILKDLQALGGTGALPDEALQDDMPVDIRVVVNWNVDETDMDLWVREPGGEVAMYSNPRTVIGGRLSNDMTNGYGPEEYLLKDAPPGAYEITMDYFSSDVVNPNGAVAIQAEIWRNYGTPGASLRRVELEFTDDEEDEYLVATIKIEGE